MKGHLHHTRCLYSNRRGSAAVEFAIIAPLLVLLATGIYDYGTALSQRTQVESAARAGAAFVTARGWDPAGISEAVSSAAPNISISAQPAPTLFCGCADETIGVAPMTCGTPCPAGDVARAYVSVGASATYPFVLPLPTGMLTVTLRATTTARVQ